MAQVISLITLPIVSRIYSVQAFGEFAIYASTLSIVAGSSALGMGSAIMAPKNDNEAKNVFFTAFVTIVIISSLFLFSLLTLSSFFKFVQISIPYSLFCILIYINLLLNGLLSILSIYTNRLKLNRVLFWNTLISVLSTLCITIPLGLLGWGVKGFITASIFAALAANIQMLFRTKPFYKLLTIKQIWSIFREYKDFVRFQFPANFLTTFAVQLPNQLFAANFGNVALGGYSMCERIMGYPIRLIATPIATIYFRQATQFVHNERINDLGIFSLKLIQRTFLLAFVPVVVLMGFSEQLFIFVLGSKWAAAGKIASILTIQYVLVFCNQYLSYCLVVLNRQKINLYFSVIQISLIILSITVGLFLFDNLIETILIFGIGNVLVQILSLLVNFYYLNIKLTTILKSILLFIGGILLCTTAIHFLFS